MVVSIEELRSRVEFCRNYLDNLSYDLLCAMFIICNYTMFTYALNNNTTIINKSSLKHLGLSTLIYDYRNAYAHLDLTIICRYVSKIVDMLPDDIEYTESMLSYIRRFKETYSSK